MQINVISDHRKIDFGKWDEFVNNHPSGTVFQSSDMYLLFINTRNFDPVPIVIMENEKIAGLMLAVIIREFSGPIGYFSSRTVIYGGPLISLESDRKDEILDMLLKELISKVKGHSIFIQFRNFTDQTASINVFVQNGFKYMERLNYLVDTQSEETVKRNISSSKLRQINKGLKTGAEIIDPENIKQVKDFYEILHYLYKYKVKKPLPAWEFFNNFYEQSKTGKLGVIKLIKFNNRIIGGILSPVFSNKVIYEWYVCGLDEEFKNVYPSVLATWAPIDYAIKNNLQVFDFMGVGIPDRDYGVREFKAKFGGELVNYGRFGRINNKFLYIITEIGFNILALLKKI
jgi:lipid II:glycine glycyltransferase (peptidoglycan interpeptide bridge formation enzyme)